MVDIASPPVITRHRHETRRRTLTVASKTYLTPHMIRIVVTGPELTDFVSLGADDHIKLFFPSGADKPLMRDYTPRAFDCAAGSLTLDFAVHEAGPATQWAIDAAPGDSLIIGGPRGSNVIAPVFDWWLLIGDETALPAIGRRAEELPSGTQVITLAGVLDQAEEQVFDAKAQVESHWIHRPESQSDDPEPYLKAAQNLTLPAGRGFVWIGAEAKVARALKDYFIAQRGHPGGEIKASGYWVRGSAATSAKGL